MVTKHGMCKEEVDIVTNTRQHLTYNYRTSIYGVQAPVVSDAVAAAARVVSADTVTATVTTASTATSSAPLADPWGGDAV